MSSPIQVRAISSHFCHGTSIAGCALRLCDEMQSDAMRLETWFPGARPELARKHLRTPFPHLATRALYAANLENVLHHRLERAYLGSFRPGESRTLVVPAGHARIELYAGDEVLLEREVQVGAGELHEVSVRFGG